MKVAVYVRVSTVDQSTLNQVPDIKRYCENKGWTDLTFFEDTISSTKKRPGLDKMMTSFKTNRFDVLVVWRLDRLFRSLKDLLVNLEALRALKIDVVSIKENLDQTTPTGKLMMHILGAFAEFEREVIVERTKAGLQRRKQEGKQIGRASKATRYQIATMHKEGKTEQEISNKTGCSLKQIQRIVDPYNMKV